MPTPNREQRGRPRGRLLLFAGVLAALLSLVLVACGDDGGGGGTTPTTQPTAAGTPAPSLSGSIEGDGSSTVFPISEAVAEEFRKQQPGVRVTVGIRGTGGGFERFCAGETDFNDASRPIKDSEAQACAGNGITYTEFKVGYDGIAVVTNTANDFVDCLTVAELKTMWEPAAQGSITNWNQVRGGFPDKGLSLYGPGTDSGTFDFFTAQINGKEDDSRGDYTASEDDNVLVQGVEGDDGGLGYFGLAYYEANQSRLRLLLVDGGGGCVAPSKTTVLDGTYTPLSRPLFVYVNNESLQRPEVAAFMRFYLTAGPALVEEVGYVRAEDSVYEADLAKIP